MIKQKRKDGKELYKYLMGKRKRSDFQKAIRFFILNRITFSGLADAGGYSEQAFEKRFNGTIVERLTKASKILPNTKITNKDYKDLLIKKGNDVFIFLDPPYYSNTKSKLYGKRGCFHEDFNHKKFAEDMRKCKYKWLITYDDDPEIRKLFSFAKIRPWKLQYGMNNFHNGSAAKGRELFISNY